MITRESWQNIWILIVGDIIVALHGAVAFPLVVGGAAGVVYYGTKYMEDPIFRQQVRTELPKYAMSAAFTTGFRQYLGLMAYARYYQPAWMAASLGFHLYAKYPDTVNDVVDSVKDFITEPVSEFVPRSFQFEWM